jgi:stearoyl-CoA desaturase (delta-9 desaturase)
VIWVLVEVVLGTWTVFDIAILFAFLMLTGIGMSVGLHRLFSHQAFEAGSLVRYTLAFLGTMAWQRPLFAWVVRHRLHHKMSDEEGDYHSPLVLFDGTPIKSRLAQFIHSHYYWLHVADPNPTTIKSGASDLSQDTGLVWIDKNYDLICVISLALPGLVAGLYYQTWMGILSGIMWGGLARIALLLHLTWIVNSACHMVGKATYKANGDSRNIAVLGWLVFGEGYHNNHHAFPYSPRMGFDPWQVDIGWSVIALLKRAGFVSGLKPIPDEKARARRLIAGRQQ